MENSTVNGADPEIVSTVKSAGFCDDELPGYTVVAFREMVGDIRFSVIGGSVGGIFSFADNSVSSFSNGSGNRRKIPIMTIEIPKIQPIIFKCFEFRKGVLSGGATGTGGPGGMGSDEPDPGGGGGGGIFVP